MESLFLEVFKNMWMWHLRTWLSGECGDAGVMAGLDILRWTAMNIINIYDQIQCNMQMPFSSRKKKQIKSFITILSVRGCL